MASESTASEETKARRRLFQELKQNTGDGKPTAFSWKTKGFNQIFSRIFGDSPHTFHPPETYLESQRDTVNEAALSSPLQCYSSELQAQAASALVCRLLQTGCWPTPYDGRETKASLSAVNSHRMVVAASVSQFVNDVILPQLPEIPASGTSVFLGTLLMLRDVLVINAGTIFGESLILDSRGDSELATACAQILASAVIVAGLESDRPMLESFWALADTYDQGELALPDTVPLRFLRQPRGLLAPTSVHVSVLEAVYDEHVGHEERDESIIMEIDH